MTIIFSLGFGLVVGLDVVALVFKNNANKINSEIDIAKAKFDAEVAKGKAIISQIKK